MPLQRLFLPLGWWAFSEVVWSLVWSGGAWLVRPHHGRVGCGVVVYVLEPQSECQAARYGAVVGSKRLFNTRCAMRPNLGMAGGSGTHLHGSSGSSHPLAVPSRPGWGRVGTIAAAWPTCRRPITPMGAMGAGRRGGSWVSGRAVWSGGGRVARGCWMG